MADKGHTELPSVIWMRDLDGSGSMHLCAKGDPGAVAYVPEDSVNTYPAVEGLVKALELSQQFIRNGLEFGYIRMPDDDSDFAHQTLPEIHSALSRFRSLQNGGAN